MKKRWDELLESTAGVKANLQKKALYTGDEKDWANYEGALIRDGELKIAIRTLERRATLSNMTTIRKLVDYVKAVPGQELMATGMLKGSPATWLVMEITGNSLRVRRRIATGLMGSRWDSTPKLLTKSTSPDLRFHVAAMREEDMPRTPGKKAI